MDATGRFHGASRGVIGGFRRFRGIWMFLKRLSPEYSPPPVVLCSSTSLRSSTLMVSAKNEHRLAESLCDVTNYAVIN